MEIEPADLRPIVVIARLELALSLAPVQQSQVDEGAGGVVGGEAKEAVGGGQAESREDIRSREDQLIFKSIPIRGPNIRSRKNDLILRLSRNYVYISSSRTTKAPKKSCA